MTQRERERRIWTRAIETYFDGPTVEAIEAIAAVEAYAEGARAERQPLPDDAAKTPEAELAALRRHRESVDAAIADLGIVEIAARNPAVLDYMQHWEGRAEKAEAEVTALRAQNAALQAERDRAMKACEKIAKRFTPKPIRYAPRDDSRIIIGVERPPCEDKTFFYDVIWCKDRKQFVSPFTRALNGATHFLDPENMIGIVWPRERAALRALIAQPAEGGGDPA